MYADDARVLNNLRDKIKTELSALITISPIVELKEPGSMPVAEGKVKRVEDKRPKD